jgi:hypothetical protein
MNLLAVFDNNIYRRLGDGALSQIKSLEGASGIRPVASNWPCLELLARCLDPSEVERSRAIAALGRLWLHAGYDAPDRRRLRMHEAGEFILLRGLFGLTVEDHIVEHDFVAHLVVRATELGLPGLVGAHAEELAAVKARVDEEERTFFGTPLDWARGTATPAELLRLVRTSSTILVVAEGLIKMLAAKYSVSLVQFDVNGSADRLARHFPVAMHFMRDLLVDSFGTESAPGGPNSTWDLKLAFHAGKGASFDGTPVVLVTDDRRLLRAADSALERRRVMPFAEYRELIQQPQLVAERAAGLSSTA